MDQNAEVDQAHPQRLSGLPWSLGNEKDGGNTKTNDKFEDIRSCEFRKSLLRASNLVQNEQDMTTHWPKSCFVTNKIQFHTWPRAGSMMPHTNESCPGQVLMVPVTPTAQ